MTVELESELLAIAMTSPALTWQATGKRRYAYPSRYRGRVPLKVVLAKDVEPDMMEFKQILNIKDDTIALKDKEYYVWVNSFGAVSAILPNKEILGLIPSEFDVTAYHETLTHNNT